MSESEKGTLPCPSFPTHPSHHARQVPSSPHRGPVRRVLSLLTRRTRPNALLFAVQLGPLAYSITSTVRLQPPDPGPPGLALFFCCVYEVCFLSSPQLPFLNLATNTKFIDLISRSCLHKYSLVLVVKYLWGTLIRSSFHSLPF